MKIIVAIILWILVLLPLHSAVAFTSQTWSKEGIQEIIREETGNLDVENLKKVVNNEITQKSEEFNSKLDAKLANQQNNFIEIIGIFSAILALLLIDVNIIKSANDWKKALWLMAGMTVSISILIILIKVLF